MSYSFELLVILATKQQYEGKYFVDDSFYSDNPKSFEK